MRKVRSLESSTTKCVKCHERKIGRVRCGLPECSACAAPRQSHQREVRLLLGDERAQMVFTDPPWNIPIAGHVSGLGAVAHGDFAMGCGEMSSAEFAAFLHTALGHAAAYSDDGAIHFVCMRRTKLRELLDSTGDLYSETKNLRVWSKTNAGMGSLYRSRHELIFVCKRGTAPHINNVELGRFGRNRWGRKACSCARSPPLQARKRRVLACPVLYRSGAPDGNRTRVSAVKGRCPRPLDDGRNSGEATYRGVWRVRQVTRASACRANASMASIAHGNGRRCLVTAQQTCQSRYRNRVQTRNGLNSRGFGPLPRAAPGRGARNGAVAGRLIPFPHLRRAGPWGVPAGSGNGRKGPAPEHR